MKQKMNSLTKYINNNYGDKSNRDEHKCGRKTERYSHKSKKNRIVNSKYIESNYLFEKIQYKDNKSNRKENSQKLIRKSCISEKFYKSAQAIYSISFFI